MKDFNSMQSECCTGQIECTEVTSFDDVINECVFLEKVYDGRTFKRQTDIVVADQYITLTPSIDSITSINFEVTATEALPTIRDIYLDDQRVPTPFSHTPGPAGNQIVLPQHFINTKQCQETLGMGTICSYKQNFHINYFIELTVKGTGLSGGVEIEFKGTKEFVGIFNTSINFKDMCFPPRSPFPVSTITPCLGNAIFDLLAYEFNPITNQVKINGDIMLCMSLETKIKVPAQICVLSAGQCKLKEEEDRGCQDKDYPPLYPVNNNIL